MSILEIEHRSGTTYLRVSCWLQMQRLFWCNRIREVKSERDAGQVSESDCELAECSRLKYVP